MPEVQAADAARATTRREASRQAFRRRRLPAPCLQGIRGHVRLTREDVVDEIEDIIAVGDFYALAAGGQIIFT